ncbi:MAG TPA: ATP-binding cassette domain-containing protein [Solirubrobacterales bacterium]|jgi:zinc/manganese transport system ATP-binding protein|nr:ATP-binding cassette domain-containing protein [Solirubrobacterales bacterium]
MSTTRATSGVKPDARQEAGEAIRFQGAAAKRGARAVWSGVDLCVRQGEFVAVLGPNGSGKSTLLHVLLGLLPLSEGTATILSGPPGSANSQIGYLPQRRSFDAGTRVRGLDLVRLGLDGTRWGFPLPARISPSGRAAARRVEEAIELVGASGYASRSIGALSGGEQQRLLIAQALVRRPRILLLDEPLDSLDLSNQGAVAALVQRICEAEGVTVLLVAHDVNPILPYLDRVIYFAGGGGVEGTPREVITGPTLSRLYGAPIEVLETSDGRLVVVGTPEPPAHHHPRHDHGH